MIRHNKEQGNVNVSTSVYTDMAGTAAAKTSETAKATMSAEYVTEHREYVVHIHACSAKAAATASSAYSFETELVVTCLFVRVAQYAVCFGSLLELFFGLLVARIFVGMILDSQFAVCLFYLGCRCCPLDAKHFIVISFCHNIVLFAYSNLCVAYYFIV